MDEQAQFYTVAILATFGGATSAVRLWVEYTKDAAARWWAKWTGLGWDTFVYALFVSYAVLYGVGALTQSLGNGMWFAHIFSGPLVAITAGAMQRKREAEKPPQG